MSADEPGHCQVCNASTNRKSHLCEDCEKDYPIIKKKKLIDRKVKVSTREQMKREGWKFSPTTFYNKEKAKEHSKLYLSKQYGFKEVKLIEVKSTPYYIIGYR